MKSWQDRGLPRDDALAHVHRVNDGQGTESAGILKRDDGCSTRHTFEMKELRDPCRNRLTRRCFLEECECRVTQRWRNHEISRSGILHMDIDLLTDLDGERSGRGTKHFERAGAVTGADD